MAVPIRASVRWLRVCDVAATEMAVAVPSVPMLPLRGRRLSMAVGAPSIAADVRPVWHGWLSHLRGPVFPSAGTLARLGGCCQGREQTEHACRGNCEITEHC